MNYEAADDGFRSTADLADDLGDGVRSCDIQFQRYGRHDRFRGIIETVRCDEDNVLVRELLSTPAEGRVLVVDGSGSLHRALMGDQMAKLAIANAWAGIIINGAIRDAAALADMDISIKALGTNPRKSLKLRDGEVGVPVSFGGVTFSPGETISSDHDGIVIIGRP